jgi:hypothetical protein
MIDHLFERDDGRLGVGDFETRGRLAANHFFKTGGDATETDRDILDITANRRNGNIGIRLQIIAGDRRTDGEGNRLGTDF